MFQSLRMFNECGYVYNSKLFIEYEFCFCFLYSSIDMIDIYTMYIYLYLLYSNCYILHHVVLILVM